MTLTEELKVLLELHAESIDANITANSCQTRSDQEDANDAEHNYENALEKFELRLYKCAQLGG